MLDDIDVSNNDTKRRNQCSEDQIDYHLYWSIHGLLFEPLYRCPSRFTPLNFPSGRYSLRAHLVGDGASRSPGRGGGQGAGWGQSHARRCVRRAEPPRQ